MRTHEAAAAAAAVAAATSVPEECMTGSMNFVSQLRSDLPFLIVRSTTVNVRILCVNVTNDANQNNSPIHAERHKQSVKPFQ